MVMSFWYPSCVALFFFGDCNERFGIDAPPSYNNPWPETSSIRVTKCTWHSLPSILPSGLTSITRHLRVTTGFYLQCDTDYLPVDPES